MAENIMICDGLGIVDGKYYLKKGLSFIKNDGEYEMYIDEDIKGVSRDDVINVMIFDRSTYARTSGMTSYEGQFKLGFILDGFEPRFHFEYGK